MYIYSLRRFYVNRINETMNRLKLFLSNFFVYGVGGVIGKLIPLIMLPIITRLMPDTTYFGLNDNSVIVVSFATYIGIMGMYDAMFRLFFDQDNMEYKRSICSSTLAFTLCTSFVIFALMMLLRKPLSLLFFSSEEYENLLILSAVSALIGTTNSIVSAPTRFLNQRKIFLVTNTIAPLISYGISVPLLLKGWYVVALPLASIISVLSIEILFWYLNKNWFAWKKVDIKLIRQLLVIALPLVPNFLVYWIFNSADRIMITNILGNDYTGIYAIGGKLGNVSQLIYTAFAGGWQYFAFSTMKDEDQVQLNSKVFEYLFVVTIISGLFIMTFGQVFFDLLFEGDYIQGAIVAPYLFIAPLLLMLYQIGCNQFLVIKKTWPNLFILLTGAVVNIILNYELIPKLGIEGAAIATLIGYIVAVVICVITLLRFNLFNLTKRIVVLTILFLGCFAIWRGVLLGDTIQMLCLFIINLFILYLMYKRDIKELWSLIHEKRR